MGLKSKIINGFKLTANDGRIPTDYDLDNEIISLNYYIGVSIPLLLTIIKKKLKLYVRYRWKNLIFRILKFCTYVFLIFLSSNYIYYKYIDQKEIKQTTKTIELIHKYDYKINNPIDTNNMILMNSISLIESTNNYKAENGQYWGAYQIGNDARTEIGLVKVDKNLFLNDQYLQDWSMNRLMHINYKSVKRYISDYSIPEIGGIRVGRYVVTISGLLAMTHSGGSGAIDRFFRSNGTDIALDGNGIPITDYLMFNNIKVKINENE